MSQQLDQIVETLSQLTVLDLANLKTMLEEKWGVQAAAAAVAMPMVAGGGAAAPAAAEESTEFNIYLKETPADKKIGIIKAVREATGLGLGEAKAFVEAGDATKPIKEKVKKAEADELKKKLEDAGAKVEVKGV